jgi:sugar O-acyltransferase (sialic acid O-acetyltransferase NeuD family)
VSLPIIIIGAGGHAKVVADALAVAGTDILGFTDANPTKWGTQVNGWPVLGGDEVISSRAPDSVLLVNGVGSAGSVASRRDTYLKFRSLGYQFMTVIHPRAVVSPHAVLGQGAQLMACAVVQPSAVIGENSIINTSAVIEHDCRIGAHCHIAPGVSISGGVCVGSETHIGTGSSIIQNVEIGAQCLVAAGSVVVGSHGSGLKLRGIPARPVT